MSFLSPVALWIAAAVVPALLILYFLKLRRKEEVVPSTFLWKRAVQDLQVNAPFQKLRKNLLLLLQLLVLLAGVVALARPIVESSLSKEGRLILLIDRSASMNTIEKGGKSRLDLAKEQAVRLVKTLNQTGSGLFGGWFGMSGANSKTKAMVITFADRASVISPFTTNASDLVALIEDIEPTDATTNMREALELAEAYMATTTLEMAPVSAEAPSKLVLISDGGVADLQDLALKSGSMELIPIGESRDNVGITALRIARNYEKPELLNVFLQIRNFGSQEVKADTSLHVELTNPDGKTERRLVAVKSVTLTPAEPDDEPGATTQPAGETGEPKALLASRADKAPAQGSSTSLGFEITLDQSGLIEASVKIDDALKVDNRAYAVVPPPRKLRVLLVSKKNFFLESVLAGLPLEQTKYMTPEQYEAAPAVDIEADGASKYDVVIFDKHDTKRLPVGNYFFIASTPQIEGISVEGEVEGQALMWWDETHPVLRYVVLDYVHVARWQGLKLPPEAERLIEGPTGPVLARYSRDGRQYLFLAFAIEASTWWGKSSFPIFAYNAIRYLGSGVAGESGASARPGEALLIPVPSGAKETTITTPLGASSKITADAAGVARYGGTSRVGVYRVSPGIEGRSTFAVNLEDEWESNIVPRTKLKLGTQAVKTGEAITTSTPEVWRWFIVAALLIALFEWYVYNRRVLI